jgi:hypothetical protein
MNVLLNRVISPNQKPAATGNALLDRPNRGDNSATPSTGNLIVDRAIHGGNTLISVKSMKGAALKNDRGENLKSKRAFSRGRYAGLT